MEWRDEIIFFPLSWNLLFWKLFASGMKGGQWKRSWTLHINYVWSLICTHWIDDLTLIYLTHILKVAAKVRMLRWLNFTTEILEMRKKTFFFMELTSVYVESCFTGSTSANFYFRMLSTRDIPFQILKSLECILTVHRRGYCFPVKNSFVAIIKTTHRLH